MHTLAACDQVVTNGLLRVGWTASGVLLLVARLDRPETAHGAHLMAALYTNPCCPL
jgi:hypothetical protein